MPKKEFLKITPGVQLRLTRFTLLVAFLLACVLAINSFSSAWAIDAPTPLTPTYGTIGTVDNYPPLGIPTFSWSEVEGATRYKIQICDDIGFSGTNLREFTTDNPFYTPRNLGELADRFADGPWYWRVRVDSPEISNYSSIMYFEKNWGSLENKPELLTPSEGASVDFYEDTVFSWNHVTGAARYRFQIATSYDGFGSPIVNILTLNVRYQPTQKRENGTYYWRVIPVDAIDVEGTPSEVRSFTQSYNTVPTLISPENYSQPIFTPTFRWSAVAGARNYRLQYSTSDDFETGTTTITTPNTSYTPLDTIPNNTNIYWRVQVESDRSVTDWSVTYRFLKQWYIKPQLLTPTNGYQYQNHPFFSWTPVPGASYYLFELASDIGFNNDRQNITTANPFATPNNYKGAVTQWYWRVTPYDRNGNAGSTSQTSTYFGYYDNIAPDLIYPLYYYTPNDFPPPADSVSMNPYEDRTSPLPLFIWYRPHVPPFETDQGDFYADAFRLQVASDQNFTNIVWSVETENPNVAPLNSTAFDPDPNTTYFWRVCPLVGSTCGPWSQVWRTRIDLSQGEAPVADTPELLQPAHGTEWGEITPWFQWKPVTGATGYDIEISLDSNFSTLVASATTSYPVYTLTEALGQRNLGILDFYTYYWRVRAKFGASNGSWSGTQRFQVAAQSQWSTDDNRTSDDLEIGSDPTEVSNGVYDLTKLFASQSQGYWHFGFDVPAYAGTNVDYAIYLDTNHYDGTGWLEDPLGPGGSSDPRGNTVSAIPAHRPEYVIYLRQIGGNFSASEGYLYSWNGSSWSDYSLLSSLGASSVTITGTNRVEVKILSTAIGDIAKGGSYSISLMSFATTGGTPQDSVPSDSSIPGSSTVSRFSSVTEKLTLAAPFNNLGGGSHIYSSVQPYFWYWSNQAPWAGEQIEVALDQGFTSDIANYRQDSNTSYWAAASQFAKDDMLGDDTYYWRVRPLYNPVHTAGVWSEPFRFERLGFIPENLQVSVTFATPMFSWDRVEGARQYQLEIDNDPSFGSPEVRVDTGQTVYTPVRTLPDGTYYWRVRAERWPNIDNNGWSSIQSFTLSLPTPSNLVHTPSPIPDRAPTLCWDHMLVDDNEGYPVLAAWKYRVQISTDSGFSSLIEQIETEQPCYTSTRGYADGTYYWRVAMIDGQNRLGSYSSTVVFTKQYPVTTLIAPTGIVDTTPIFEWTPVDGASSYRIEISTSPTFGQLYDSFTLNNARFTPTKKYDFQTTYYWRVAMIDRDGKYGPFTGEEIIVDPFGYRVYLPLVIR